MRISDNERLMNLDPMTFCFFVAVVCLVILAAALWSSRREVSRLRRKLSRLEARVESTEGRVLAARDRMADLDGRLTDRALAGRSVNDRGPWKGGRS